MKEFGVRLTNLKIFRDGINIGFCEILDSKNAILKVFERGVGLTFACGSGACAAGFLAYKNKFLDSKMIFHFLNQDLKKIDNNNSLKIKIDENKNIIMEGIYKYVFYGFYKF
jgi:diaminopimelate epimerase